jgi:DNA replication regulator SLD2
VLGLFDLLSEEGEDSPLKGHITVIGPDGKVQGTPRKPIGGGEDIPGTSRHSRTPASSGKRFMLDSFATPLNGRHPNEKTGKTPSSVSKLNFATPLFLRRDIQRTTMGPISETGDALIPSPEMVRLPRKPLVRGLSSMLAGLRKMEEEAADDDLDALREIENETNGPSKPVNKSTILVEDSQVPVLLGGFDDEAMYDSEPEEIKNPTLGRDGQPLKIWKKKGQRRTTRRVIIKPVRAKPHPALPAPDSPSEDLVQHDENDVPETQQADSSVHANAGNFDSDSGSEYTASEGGTRYRRPNQQKKTKDRTGEGKVKTAVRKVGAMAHANFKRLKLRNSGSKGGVAHNSRFGRKR